VLLVGSAVLLTPLWLWLWELPGRQRARHAATTTGTGAAFTAPWRMQLARDCVLYRQLPLARRRELERLASTFMARHRFVGCGGLTLDAGMVRLIAVQACLLVVARGIEAYAGLGAVLVYPEEFVAPQEHVDEAGVVTVEHEPLSGQSSDTGGIVLSWADVQAGAREGGGYNVVVHEFAHFLDHASGGALSSPGDARRRALLRAELATLRALVDRGVATLIDPYAATDDAEFFAVASEHFFGEPDALKGAHPALHALLAGAYGFDPAAWATST
jgi:Mlc titration factor MtfA (ptsG expression regulator)